MKKLVIRSENEDEDKKAAAFIQKNTSNDADIDEVVWYSHLGTRLAQVDELMSRASLIEKRTENLSLDQFTTKTNLSNLQRHVDEIQEKITLAEGRLHLLETTKKQRKQDVATPPEKK